MDGSGLGRREREGMVALEGGAVVEEGTGGRGEEESGSGVGIRKEGEGECGGAGGRSSGRGCKAMGWTGGEAPRRCLRREIEGAIGEEERVAVLVECGGGGGRGRGWEVEGRNSGAGSSERGDEREMGSDQGFPPRGLCRRYQPLDDDPIAKTFFMTWLA